MTLECSVLGAAGAVEEKVIGLQERTTTMIGAVIAVTLQGKGKITIEADWNALLS